ncbi:MAG: BACON domain-containing protein, partial [Firmicutes bacterium]|nr:BACON domain-containing protein [Bacillota bacterium]
MLFEQAGVSAPEEDVRGGSQKSQGEGGDHVSLVAAPRKEGDKETTFEVSFTNSSSQTESWAISGLPTWLTVNATSGALAPMGTETVTFTVDPSLAYGSYEATVRLKGSLGVGEPMVVNVVSGCEAP